MRLPTERSADAAIHVPIASGWNRFFIAKCSIRELGIVTVGRFLRSRFFDL